MMEAFSIHSEIMGYHEYKLEWNPIIAEEFQTRREPENVNDAFAVCVLKGEHIVGHLKKGDNGRFARTVFYFLCADARNRCDVQVTGIPVNHGDMMGMKVPCKLIFYGHCRFLHVLRAELVKKD